MTLQAAKLRGRKILVVEDNFLVAELVRDTLARAGCEVVGPAPSVEHGLGLLRDGAVDAAVLDINLNGETCFALAAALAERSVPFVFLTGYDDAAVIPPAFRSVVRLSKPVDDSRLAAMLARLFGWEQQAESAARPDAAARPGGAGSR